MEYDSGDKVTLGKIGEFTIVDKCDLDNKKYYLLMKNLKKDSGIILVEEQSENSFSIIDDKKIIEKAIEKMVED